MGGMYLDTSQLLYSLARLRIGQLPPPICAFLVQRAQSHLPHMSPQAVANTMHALVRLRLALPSGLLACFLAQVERVLEVGEEEEEGLRGPLQPREVASLMVSLRRLRMQLQPPRRLVRSLLMEVYRYSRGGGGQRGKGGGNVHAHGTACACVCVGGGCMCLCMSSITRCCQPGTSVMGSMLQWHRASPDADMGLLRKKKQHPGPSSPTKTHFPAV